MVNCLNYLATFHDSGELFFLPDIPSSLSIHTQYSSQNRFPQDEEHFNKLVSLEVREHMHCKTTYSPHCYKSVNPAQGMGKTDKKHESH